MILSWFSCYRLPSPARHGHAWTNWGEGHQDCHRAGAQAGKGQAENWAGPSLGRLRSEWERPYCCLWHSDERIQKRRQGQTLLNSAQKLAYLKLWLHRRKPSFNRRPVKRESQIGCAISSRRAIQSSPSRAIPTSSGGSVLKKTQLPSLPWASFNLIYSLTLWSNQLPSFLVSTPNIKRFS